MVVRDVLCAVGFVTAAFAASIGQTTIAIAASGETSASASVVVAIRDIRNVTAPGNLTDLTIVGIPGLLATTGGVFPSGKASGDASGDARVDAFDPFSMSVSDSISLGSQASGTASVVGNVISFHVAGGTLDMFNDSTSDTFEIDLEISYSLSVEATADDPDVESAEAKAAFDVLSLSQSLDRSETLLATSTSSKPPASDTIMLTLILPPESADAIDVTVQADGDAAAIPAVGSDGDVDGVVDYQDDCLGVVNPTQLDTNGDGYGNACDGDLNNDAATNTLDLQIYRTAHRTCFGDPAYIADADLNGDGCIDTLDLQIYRGLHRRPPGPSCCGTL